MKKVPETAVPWILFALAILLFILGACNKAFDQPPIGADPDIAVNMTISQLKSRYVAAGVFQSITDDWVITGVVIADDRSGNFYKQIVIQDSTGGIPILLDGNNVYAMYPIGRRIFIRLKGLMLGDYGGNIQLGLDSTRSSDGRFLNLGRIPQAKFDRYILKGSFGNEVKPKLIKPSEITKAINDPLLSTLITIDNVEFRESDLAKTYADTTLTQSAINFTVRTCDNQGITLRNSSYAWFASEKLPPGNGSLVAVAGIFNSTIQLTIRDTTDLHMYGNRCSGQVPVETVMPIGEVLKYAAGDSIIPAGTYIEGVVISSSAIEEPGNYRLQDSTAGIHLRFNKGKYPEMAAMGEKLSVYVGGLKLGRYKGSTMISGVEVSRNTGPGLIASQTINVSDIRKDVRRWESMLVTIKDVSITQAGDEFLIRDSTGELGCFVESGAGIGMPESAESITGYISIQQMAGGPESVLLVLRSSEDITGGKFGSPVTTFSVVFDFAGVTNQSGSTDPTAPPVVEGLTFSAFKAIGVGGSSGNPSAGGRFSFTGWPLGASSGSDVFTGSADMNKYYELTITPGNGKKFDISKLSFTLQRSGTGVRQVMVRSGIDSFSGNMQATVEPANENITIVGNNIFQIREASTTAQNGCTIEFGSVHTELADAVTIRFYGFNARTAGGSFSIDNVRMEGKVWH